LMPVITPAYPQMCATFNITQSNKAIIQRELERAGLIADRIVAKQVLWQELFVKHTFFTNGYKYYLAVVVTSKAKEAHKIWSGFVESKVRVLIATLERHKSIAIAHPFNKGFERVHKVKSEQEFEAVSDGNLDYIVKASDQDGDATKQENGSSEPKVEEGAKPEPATSSVDGGIKPESTSADVNSVPTIPDAGEDTNVKTEDLPVTDDKIYTTTHYIGLELAEGKCPSHCLHDITWSILPVLHMYRSLPRMPPWIGLGIC
jgi:poly(A) polymerase